MSDIDETHYEVVAIFPDPLTEKDIRRVLSKHRIKNDTRLDDISGPFITIATIVALDETNADAIVTKLRDDDSVISVGVIKPCHRFYQLELEFDQYTEGIEEIIAKEIGWDVQEMNGEEPNISATYGCFFMPYDAVLHIKDILSKQYPTFRPKWSSGR